MLLGDTLRYYRVKNKKTLREVATYLNVNQQTVWRWENNKRTPSIVQLRLLVEYYEIPTNECGVFLKNNLEKNRLLTIGEG